MNERDKLFKAVYREQAKNHLPEVWIRFVEAQLQSPHRESVTNIWYYADELLEEFKKRFVK